MLNRVAPMPRRTQAQRAILVFVRDEVAGVFHERRVGGRRQLELPLEVLPVLDQPIADQHGRAIVGLCHSAAEDRGKRTVLEVGFAQNSIDFLLLFGQLVARHRGKAVGGHRPVNADRLAAHRAGNAIADDPLDPGNLVNVLMPQGGQNSLAWCHGVGRQSFWR